MNDAPQIIFYSTSSTASARCFRSLASHCAWAILLLALVARPSFAATPYILGEIHAEPGELVSVPIHLDDASGLANIEFQLNYDPSFLQYEGYATTNTLSSGFTTEVNAQDGVLYIAAARAAALASGSGVFIRLLMRPVLGSMPGVTMSDLVVAKSVQNLEAPPSSQNPNGEFWVVFSRTTDSDSDGASDYEEQITDGTARYNPYNPILNPTGTGADIHNPDTDGDGIPDGIEIARGYGVADPAEWLAFGGDLNHPALEQAPNGIGINWYGLSNHLYRLQYTTDSIEWMPVPGAENLNGTHGNNQFRDSTATNARLRWYRILLLNP